MTRARCELTDMHNTLIDYIIIIPLVNSEVKEMGKYILSRMLISIFNIYWQLWYDIFSGIYLMQIFVRYLWIQIYEKMPENQGFFVSFCGMDVGIWMGKIGHGRWSDYVSWRRSWVPNCHNYGPIWYRPILSNRYLVRIHRRYPAPLATMTPRRQTWPCTRTQIIYTWVQIIAIQPVDRYKMHLYTIIVGQARDLHPLPY